MNNPLFLFVGPSGCGKTTVVETLEANYGHKSIQSYTTRAPRYDGETGHTFISDEEFALLDNIVAYTEYNGKKYCTTQEQLDNANLYVVDVPGVETLLNNYTTTRPIRIFYFDSTVTTRIDRMIDRDDSDTAIVGRLRHDEAFDWHKHLQTLVWHYENIVGTDIKLHLINANESKENVLESVLSYIHGG